MRRVGHLAVYSQLNISSYGKCRLDPDRHRDHRPHGADICRRARGAENARLGANGAPFRRLLNQNVDIPPEASRIHGYTREILERDGFPAHDVYHDFSAYVGTLPLVAYNLRYDLDEVLKPEWKRLGIDPIGTVGFCAMRLAQRLLDPVPAGNCKLQTLRQFYRLPERGAHTASVTWKPLQTSWTRFATNSGT